MTRLSKVVFPWLQMLLISAGLLWSKQSYAADEYIPLAVSVNTADKGEYFVVLRDKKSILIANKDIDALGIVNVVASENIEGQDYVALDKYPTDIKYAIDLNTLKLNLNVTPHHLKKFTKNLAAETLININPFRIESAYLNASANARGVDDNSYRTLEFPLEAVVITWCFKRILPIYGKISISSL